MRWLVALLLTAVAVGGCGDDGLDKADLADRASTICLKYTERAQDLERPDFADFEQTRTYFGEAQQLAERQLDELGEITPDASVEDEFGRLVDTNTEAAEVFGTLSETSPTEAQGRFAELITELQTLQSEVNEAAVALGAQQCGNGSA